MKKTALAILLALASPTFAASRDPLAPVPAGPPAPTVVPPSVVPAASPDHLQPDDRTTIPKYRSAEERVFKDLFAHDVIAWVLAEPSFEREYGIGLINSGSGYRVFVLEPSDQIWQFITLDMMKKGQITSTDSQGRSTTADQIREIEARLPPHPEDLKVSRCDLSISGTIARRILDAWRLMLANTAHTNVMGLDGEIYHFGLRNGGAWRTGQTWSPDENTNPYRLVLIADAMRKACKTMTAAHLSAIPALADAIAANQK